MIQVPAQAKQRFLQVRGREFPLLWVLTKCHTDLPTLRRFCNALVGITTRLFALDMAASPHLSHLLVYVQQGRINYLIQRNDDRHIRDDSRRFGRRFATCLDPDSNAKVKTKAKTRMIFDLLDLIMSVMWPEDWGLFLNQHFQIGGDNPSPGFLILVGGVAQSFAYMILAGILWIGWLIIR